VPKLPVYTKAIASAIGAALTALIPYITDKHWTGWIGVALTVAAVVLSPKNADPAPKHAADSRPAGK
jgi:hypothetical protein